MKLLKIFTLYIFLFSLSSNILAQDLLPCGADIVLEATTINSVTTYSVSLDVNSTVEPSQIIISNLSIGTTISLSFPNTVSSFSFVDRGPGLWDDSRTVDNNLIAGDDENFIIFRLTQSIESLHLLDLSSNIFLFSFTVSGGTCHEDVFVVNLGTINSEDIETFLSIFNISFGGTCPSGDFWSGNTARVPGGSCSAVPVELTTFDAEKHNNKQSLLTWETASELNNDRFEVERSADGIDFGVIGEVKGFGTTTATQYYSFIDANPVAGTNYYRLRQVDFDGAFEYTDIKSVHFGEATQSFSVFPNPASDELQINTPFFSNQSVDIHIFNNQGQLMKQQTFGANNRHTLNISDLANGLYLIQLTSGNERHEQSVVVHRP